MRVPRIRNRFVLNLLRFIALAVIIGVSGVIAGMAVGTPLGRLNFSTSKAIRLDQTRLAGSVDPEVAVATAADLPVGWTPGEPAVAAFGILANEFCGESVDMPAALSGMKSSVFVSSSGDSTLISQAVRVEQWQSAREYVRSVDRIMSDCDKFFQADAEGKRLRIDVKDGQGEPPITDFVARTYVAADGSSVQTWSIMSVGDVVLGLRHLGKSAPQHSFMTDLQNHILMRLAPQTFLPESGDTRDESTSTSPEATETTVIEGGAADESSDNPTIDESGPDATTDTPSDTGGTGDEPRD